MKKNLFAFVLLLMGCTADEQFEQILGSGTSEREPVPVTFSVSEVLDLTRASSSIVTFDANEQIMVQVKPDGESDYTGYTYTTASAGQSSITLNPPSTPPYFPAGASTTVQAYAYYPATAGSSATFTVQDNQTSDANYKASDLMYAGERTITKGSEDGNNNLRMAHLMAQLHLTVAATALTVNRVLVFAKRSATFSTTQGTATATGDTDSIVAATAAGQAYVCIPPQAINTVVVKVETGAPNVAATTATFTFTSTSDFEKGKSYPISLNVRPAHLATTTEIEGWDGTSTYALGYMTIDDIDTCSWDGGPVTPEPVVKFNGVTLTKDDDYTVEYINNNQGGTASVIVKGKAGTDYEGITASKSFFINDIRVNPLWWVAEFNTVNNAMQTAHSTTSQTVYTFQQASQQRVAGYHLPTVMEQRSIIPSNVVTGVGTNLLVQTGTPENPYAFSEVISNVGGKNVAAYTSYWFRNAKYDYYAVRFIGTPYASVWHYKYVGSPCNGMLIESYLEPMADATAARAVLAAINPSNPAPLTETAGAGTANQRPVGTASTTFTTKGFVQRFLPACGFKAGSGGTADQRVGVDGYYWSSSADGSNAFYWAISSYGDGHLYEYSLAQTYGFSVRLFRD